MHDTLYKSDDDISAQGSYQHSSEAVDVTQGQGDVDEHNGVADYYGADVTVALSVQFIFNTPLCTKGYGQVGVFEVLHELDESEMHTKSTLSTRKQQ